MQLPDFLLRSLRWLVLILFSLCAVLTVTALFERFWWRAYLLAQFRVELLIFAVVCAGLLALSRRSRLLAIGALACAIINSWPLLPSQFCFRPQASSAGSTLRCLQINLNNRNHEYQSVIACVRSTKPDVLMLEEVTPDWAKALSGQLSEYQYKLLVPRDDTYGIGVLSKQRLLSAKVEYYGRSGHPSILCSLPNQTKPITILQTHIQGPVRKELFELHKEQLLILGDVLCNQKGPILVSGDMNATPWTYLLSDFLAKAKLEDSQCRSGIQLTWPAPLYWRHEPFTLLALDHFFMSRELVAVRRETGPYVGSDHFPVLIDIAVSQ